MHEVGWGAVDQAVLRAGERALRRSRRRPASYIAEATMLGGSPEPAAVARLLNAAGVDFVIIGAHALGVHTKEPRATADVDVVVSDLAAAVTALRRIRPKTKVLNLGAEIGKRIATPAGVELVDVLLPSGGVRGHLFDNRLAVELDGEPASIPTLTAMFALKWLAMFSPARVASKQVQDKADFLRLLETHPKADMTAVARMVAKASQSLGAQLLHDLKEYKRTGDIRLFGA